MREHRERILRVDTLNITACAGVLLLHCLAGDGTITDGFSINRLTGLLVLSFVLWPVNVFFMLSGYTLIGDNTPASKDAKGILGFYGKRLKRILIPILFWNTVYACIYIISNLQNGQQIDIKHFGECTRNWSSTPSCGSSFL